MEGLKLEKRRIFLTHFSRNFSVSYFTQRFPEVLLSVKTHPPQHPVPSFDGLPCLQTFQILLKEFFRPQIKFILLKDLFNLILLNCLRYFSAPNFLPVLYALVLHFQLIRYAQNYTSYEQFINVIS